MSNSVTVTGTGSVWDNSFALTGGGGASAGNLLVVSSGGAVSAPHGYISGNGNTAIVTGTGSVWSNYNLYVGYYGARNTLVITNGARVISSGDNSFLGFNSGSTRNSALVTGSGSVWSNRYDLYVGRGLFRDATFGNTLMISDGGVVFDDNGYVGATGSGSRGSNSGLVTGSGSVWRNNHGLLIAGPGSALVISNGGCVSAASANLCCGNVGSVDRITVAKGTLYATNAGNGRLQINNGILSLNGGTITADSIQAYSAFIFNGGVLNSAGTAVANGQQFVVGDGTNSATFHLLGGVHSFNDGLRIRTNSFLTGCGTIDGNVVVDAGGTVLADCGGTLTFTDNVTNNGVMMASNGSVLGSSGTLVNNGTILLLDSSTPNFHGTLISNGVILKPEIHLAIERDDSGGSFIRFTGAPEVTYRLHRAASVTGLWSALATNTAPASGLIEYHEPSPPPGQVFYRTLQP